MDRLPQPSSQPFPGPSPAPSSSLPPYHPPPAQIPFSDPFHNRDPFLPSASQRSRRESYGMLSSGVSAAPPPGAAAAPVTVAPYGERAWSTQPPAHHQQHNQAPANPPSLPSAHPSAQMSGAAYPYSSSRRSSLGSDRYVGGGPLEPPPPPPPPPPFAARNMPPPSPTSGPSSSAFSMPAPRHTPSASPYVGSRELPGFGSRPGATMSISSLIGADSSRHGNHSPRTSATAPSPPLKPIHPPSPQRARSASTRATTAQFPRPHSPANMLQGPRSAAEPKAQPYHPSVSHPPPPYGQSGVTAGFRPYRSSPSSAHADEPHVYSGHAPSRPNSQPMHAHIEQELRHRQDLHDRPPPHHPTSFPPYADHVARTATASQPPPRSDDRPEMNGHSHHAPPPPAMSHTARSTPGPGPQPFGRINYGPSREEYPGLFRPAVHMASREEAEQRGPHNERRHSPLTGDVDGRPKPSAAHYALYGPVGYEIRDGDEHPLQRAFLGVASDISRKNGRASPLPQAVQGAQPRHIGPGADPSVKSEFGRMFSGLGSGVGSNTPTAGLATPSRYSPPRHVDGNEEMDGRKGRSRLREDDGREGSDSAEGRNTPPLSQRGSKRPKTTHPPPPAPHHHHHHGHAHHHHHHHHGLPEDQLVHQAPPFNTLRFPPNASVPPQVAAAGHHHHHHHHHTIHPHQPHHHHHSARPPPAPSHRRPQTTVSNRDLLSSVSKLPRKHLGSQLYSTRLGLPPRESTPLDTKYHFKSSVKPIPRFEAKDNCTFTVRVPRAYIGSLDSAEDGVNAVAGGLEEICRTRALWGSEVYSDDSDPVAAAVHSGWIRGDFGDYNQDLRDLFDDQGEDKSETAPIGQVITEKPKVPFRPPPGADLHVTLLLLPALTHYAASTQHFLRSREWGADHDGVSYMINSIEFVNESSANRFSERTAAAKHQRIKEDLARRREAAESLLGLLQSTGGTSSAQAAAGSSVSVGA